MKLHLGRITGASVLVLALVVGLGACATTGEGGARGDQRLITFEELEAIEAPNMFDAIQRLRPRWLQSRGARSLDALGTGILVYFNDSRVGSPEEALRNMPVEGIRRVEYLDSAAAARLPGAGSGHVEAAIMVYTRIDP